MKELSIEEKAKRYDEAKRRGLDYIRLTPATELVTRQSILEHIFPELRESEDEKIRKAIHIYLDWLDGKKDYAPRGEYTIRDMIAWLEKQGEHANFRNKIEIGDKVTRNEDGVLVNLSQLNRVAKKQTEQKLYVNDNAKEMFIKALERVEEQNNKGYKLTDCDKNSWWEDFKAYTSCTIEQKPAEWSEENEKMFEHIIAKATLHFSSINYLDEEEINFLKSLRPQPHWKPSDEQMEVLAWCKPLFADPKLKGILESLIEDLKKLREE